MSWKGRANLTLDQINPVPHLKAPVTAPADRPPVEALVLYGRSREATLRGQSQLAIELLQQAITLDPYRFALRYDLGWAYVNANANDDSAIAAFEKAARLEPNNLDLQTELGRLYLDRSNLPQAIEHLRLALQTSEYTTDDGKAAVADFYLGKTLKEAGYDRAALNQYSVLIRRFDNPSMSLGQNSELAYLLQRPDSLLVEVGELLEKHGQYADAIRAFAPAVDRQPDNFELQARFARDLAMDGQGEAAINKAVDLIVRNRATPASLAVLKDVCRALNLDDGVVTTLRKLSASRPDDQAVLFALTDTLVARHRIDEAHHLLQSAWEKSPAQVPPVRRLFAMDKQQDQVIAAARVLIHAFAVNTDALHNYAPLWSELTRIGLPHHLTLESVSALKVPPSDEAARQFWISMTAGDEGRPVLERSAIEASARVNPPFAPAYRALLNLDWDRPDWTNTQKIAACEKLSAAAKMGGDPALAAELAGRSLVKQMKWSLSIDDFAQAVRLGGRTAELILTGANASRELGRDPRYEQLLWQLVGDRPEFEEGFSTLFQYYTSAEPPSIEQAMRVLSTWLASDPQDVSARVLQAAVDMQSGQMRDAEVELLRLYDDDADDPDIFRAMRRFYTQTGRLNELIGKLEDQRTAHPRDTDLVARLVALYADQKRNAEAMRLLDTTRALVADDPDLLYALTASYEQLDQKQTADEILQQVVKLDPSHPGACNDLGFSWADRGKNLPRAEELIRVAVAAEPDSESFLDSLGWVLYKRGKFSQAKQYLQQAIAPEPSPDPVVLDHLGDTLYRLSQADEACKVWQESLKGLGDEQASRDDLKQLRLQLLQKIKQAEAKKPVDVAPVAEQTATSSAAGRTSKVDAQKESEVLFSKFDGQSSH